MPGRQIAPDMLTRPIETMTLPARPDISDKVKLIAIRAALRATEDREGQGRMRPDRDGLAIEL
jgi:hypothetical protein